MTPMEYLNQLKIEFADPGPALIMMMLFINGGEMEKYTLVDACCLWEMINGSPTWESLEGWAKVAEVKNVANL